MGTPVLVVHDRDPAESILEEVGSFCEGLTMLGADVFIVMYERVKGTGGSENRTRGGLIVPDVSGGTTGEDKWQGKVGLVMKMGPIAFQEDDAHQWGGIAPKVGDWVIINVSQTFSFDIPVYGQGEDRALSPKSARRARTVQDIYIKGIVSPEIFNAIW
jgi:co-chaperonin GroES (HSP10)